jgi:hypothetical protein
MRRREFIAGFGSAAAAGPVMALQRAMSVVGFIVHRAKQGAMASPPSSRASRR